MSSVHLYGGPINGPSHGSGSNPMAELLCCLACCGAAAAASAGAQAGSGNCDSLSAFSWVLIIGGLGLAITGCLLLPDSNLWGIAIAAGIFVAAAGLGTCFREQNRSY